MNNVSNQLFFCYAWEDLAKVKNIIKELEDELKSKISNNIDSKNYPKMDNSIYNNIEDAEIFVIFISDASKKSDYVKACVTHALNLNKNIIPIEIEKQSIFSSTPEEFKFRSKPYTFIDNDSKAMLFAQLKAALGVNVESGDGFGSLIHIITDRNAQIFRYGEDLGVAVADKDYTIRLKKGTHQLDFVDIEDNTLKYSISYLVEGNDNEQFLNVPLCKLMKEKKLHEEKNKREEEIKRKFEEENFKRNLELEQKKRESEIQRQIQENQIWTQKHYKEIQQERQKKEEKGPGCWTISIIVILGISFPISLFFTLPYLYFTNKKD